MSAPRLVIIAGPNGSGKTTLTRQLLADGFDFGKYINPDDIAATLDGAYEERVRRAQKIADELRDRFIAEKRDFAFETVMSHESKLEVMRRARVAGFHLTLLFVATENPCINVERVEARVRRGGHSVPHDRIIARYARTMTALIDAMLLVDRTVLFDNSLLSSGLLPCAEIMMKHVSSGGSASVSSARRVASLPLWVKSAFIRLAERLPVDEPGAQYLRSIAGSD
jgi:predicted ABC-type ATPase